MTFQKVLRVPKGILRGTEDMRFLHKSDLEKLSEHDLFFFLRTSDYHILDDYPCMGAFERRLDFSKIEGPFENAPKIEQRGGRGYSESEKDILERLVPSNIMPVTFQAITYASYGIAVDENNQRHLGLVAENRINPNEIWAAGNTILANLQKRGTKIMSYLYLIIPPIVIVLSLSILLVLISRKSQNIIAEKEKTENGDYKENQREGILKMSAGKFGQFLLRISEKSAISFKVFSLRVHNLLEKWLKYIKEKRAGNRKNISKKN